MVFNLLQGDKMDSEYLVNAEFSDQHRIDQLEKLAKEITLFDFKEEDGMMILYKSWREFLMRKRRLMKIKGINSFNFH